MDDFAGGCSCGRVRFLVRGQPEFIGACHCRDCRRHTGAPAAVYADIAVDRLEMLGDPIDWFETSPGAHRGFCRRCGATLAYRGSNLPLMVHVHIGAFDEPAAFPPKHNEQTESRLSWLGLLIGD